VLDASLPAGRSTHTWRPTGLADGVYLLRADIGGTVAMRRVVWLGGGGAAR
jgi:hypothetical protein